MITPCRQDTFIHSAMAMTTPFQTDTLTNQVLHILQQAAMSFHQSHDLTHIAVHTHHHAMFIQHSTVTCHN